MKRKVFLTSLVALVLVGCNKLDMTQQATTIAKDTEAINENAKTILGEIDPTQDWNSTNKGEVTITADADLENIVKVQILTESPFLNDYAKVLCEASATSGQAVTMTYEAPNVYTKLVAACVNSDGVYYIKGFNTSQSMVSFQSTNAANKRAGRRAAEATFNFPDITNFWLPYDNSFKSYNAMRAISAASGNYNYQYVSLWKDSGWDNDRMWRNNSTVNSSAANYTVTFDNGWENKNFSIRQQLTGGISADDQEELETIFNTYLKWTKDSTQLNNLEKIRESNYVKLFDNTFTANGDPIILTPVQATSCDMKYCDLYYYYYNPADVTGDEAQYIRELPKIMAMACGEAMLNTSGSKDFYKNYQYVLPYYGEKPAFNNYLNEYELLGTFRIRNGYVLNGESYYMTYSDDSDEYLATKNDSEDKAMQLWQVFKNNAGECYLFNIGKHSIVYNETGNKSWLLKWSSDETVTASIAPYLLNGDNENGYQLLGTDSKHKDKGQMLGSDLDKTGTKDPNRFNHGIWTDKTANDMTCRWFLEPYEGNDVATINHLTCNKNIQAQSYAIPAGYKVGFLLKVAKKNSGDAYKEYKDKSYNATDNGEVYADGRLNTQINQYPDYFYRTPEQAQQKGISFTMKEDDPRAAIFCANNKTYLTLEDGCDCNYVDMIIELTSGFNTEKETPKPKTEAYTMCFEDRPLTADYDLNDVVLRCTRKDATTLTLSLVACGGNDDVVIHGATGWAYDKKEVHEAFGMTEKTGDRFINTVVGGTKITPLSGDVIVAEDMTITDYLKNIWIENKTTGTRIRIAEQGEAPFAIIIPIDFDYPKERISIVNSYLKFKEWANDATTSTDWYLYHVKDQVYTNPFNE